MTFPRYPDYKDSGVEWLGKVPGHWQVLQAKRMATLTYGEALPSETRDESGGVPVFGSNGQVGTHDQANTLAPAILVGRKGSCGALNWTNRPAFAIDTVYFVDQRSIRCHLRWLYWTYHITSLDKASQDTGVPGLPREYAHDVRIAAPPAEEQLCIAAFLDRETAKIDALVAEQERLIELLKEKRQAVISHAVTKGLDPNVRMKGSGVEWFGEVPAHWTICPLKTLTPADRQIMYGIVLPGPDVEQGVPIVKGGDVRPHRLKQELLCRTTPEIELPYARARLKTNDIVYSIRGTIGDAELVPSEIEGANITQDVARIAPKTDIEHRWLLWAMKSSPVFYQLKQRSLGAAVPGINIFDLKRARVPVPPRSEQKQIAEFLDKAVARVDALCDETERAITSLAERRSALISAAVTGKIDVRGLVQVEDAA